MTRQILINALKIMRDNYTKFDDDKKVIDEAIYYVGIIDQLKKERDAALDTAFAALKMRKEKKDG